MKIKLALAAVAIALTFAACSSTPSTGTIVSVGLSGTLLDKLYAGTLAGTKSGFTVYQFANDTKGGTTSACTGGCATTWPPVTVTGSAQLVAGSGASQVLATIARNDIAAGTLQVTYGGSPLYFYSGDSVVGATNGASVPNWSLVAK